jgi:hypothetical protein
MPTAIPESRLPLEPEEYPIYRPPRRLGCSGLSIVTLLTIFLFAFLFLRVTPRLVESFRNTVSAQFNQGSDSGTPIVETSADGGGTQDAATQVAVVPPVTDTPVPLPPTPTPAAQCVEIINSALILRQTANTAERGTRLPIGTVLQLLEPGTPPVTDNKGNTWRHVQTQPTDGAEPKTGFVLFTSGNNTYLKEAQCP